LPKSLLAPARWAVLIPALLIGSFALIACGNGDDDATDEEYVRDLCIATNDFLDALFEDLFELLFAAEFDPEAEEEFAEAAAGLFRDFADDLSGISTPPDVRQYHDQWVASIERVTQELEAGNIEAFEEFDEDLEFPQEIEDRLAAAAADVPECQELGMF
jgi:hypothetical protein